jgi:high-affinity K+ transport system ATPase subunit B
VPGRGERGETNQTSYRDHSGGTTVLSDRIVVKITTKPGESFVDRMIALVEGAAGRRRPTRSR